MITSTYLFVLRTSYPFGNVTTEKREKTFPSLLLSTAFSDKVYPKNKTKARLFRSNILIQLVRIDFSQILFENCWQKGAVFNSLVEAKIEHDGISAQM